MYSGASLFLLVTIVSHLSVLTAILGALVVIIIPRRIHFEEALLKSS
jgi:protein-S-isoprenylcysteine O-methyltransferase Ste14